MYIIFILANDNNGDDGGVDSGDDGGVDSGDDGGVDSGDDGGDKNDDEKENTFMESLSLSKRVSSQSCKLIVFLYFLNMYRHPFNMFFLNYMMMLTLLKGSVNCTNLPSITLSSAIFLKQKF